MLTKSSRRSGQNNGVDERRRLGDILKRGGAGPRRLDTFILEIVLQLGGLIELRRVSGVNQQGLLLVRFLADGGALQQEVGQLEKDWVQWSRETNGAGLDSLKTHGGSVAPC